MPAHETLKEENPSHYNQGSLQFILFENATSDTLPLHSTTEQKGS